MASNYWIKWWIEVIDDPKMGRLPDNLWRRFSECCCLAGEVNEDGRLPAIHDIAWRLHIEEETLRGEFDQLARIGLLDFINKPLDEHWAVVNFSKRQSRMSGAERVKRHRENNRKQEYYETCNEVVTDCYTDTDTDTDNRYRLFVTAFINASKLPLFGDMKPRDNEALNRWIENDCIVEDIIAAVAYSSDNGLPIVGPASVDKGVMIARSNRLRTPKKKTTLEMLAEGGYK